MGRNLGVIIGIGALVLTAGVAQEARACSCFGSSTLLAPDGAEHPQGASLAFISSCGGAVSSWTATVDGVPAMLTSIGGYEVHRVTIEPEPPVGAEVVLSVSCEGENYLPECGDSGEVIERARFTIGAADTTAPTAADAIMLEQEAGSFNIGCDESTLDLRLGASIDVGAPEPGTWVAIQFLSDGNELRNETRVIGSNGQVESSHYLDRSEIAGTEACISVTVVDAAGNAAEPQQDCVEISGSAESCAVARTTSPSAWLWLGLVPLFRRRRGRSNLRGSRARRATALRRTRGSR